MNCLLSVLKSINQVTLYFERDISPENIFSRNMRLLFAKMQPFYIKISYFFVRFLHFLFCENLVFFRETDREANYSKKAKSFAFFASRGIAKISAKMQNFQTFLLVQNKKLPINTNTKTFKISIVNFLRQNFNSFLTKYS